MGAEGIVAAGDPQTADAGALVLHHGGNAVDAVVAAAFASFVCELPLTSPAGAGLLLFGTVERGWTLLDFFARAPGVAGGPERLDFYPIEIDFGPAQQSFHVGRAAAAVPGALRGLIYAHRRYGRLPMGEVLAPAKALARKGYRLSPDVGWIIRLLSGIFTLTEDARALVGDRADLPQGGEVLKNPGLAALFEGLERNPEETLRAFEDDLIKAFSPKLGGLLSRADLELFAPLERAPLTTTFAGCTVLLPPPPFSGGGLVALGLRMAERHGVLERRFGEHWIALGEVLRAVSRARTDGYDRRVSEPGFLEGLLASAQSETSLGGTTHISVLDGRGGAAALTATNGEGCGHALSRWGVHVNNLMGEADIHPEGFHTLAPGASLTSMMTPTVVLRDAYPVLVLGSGGSNRIRSAVLEALINHLGFGLGLGCAVATDRMHVEGDRLWYESTSMSEACAAAVERPFSHASRFTAPNMFFGGVHAVAQRGEELVGAGDARRGGAVRSAKDPKGSSTLSRDEADDVSGGSR